MVVYFLQGKESKNWKIGYTSQYDPEIRINSLKKENKFEDLELKGLLLGGRDKEDEIHQLFSQFKLERGVDYFQDAPEIHEFVNKNCFSMERYREMQREEKISRIKENFEEISNNIEAYISKAEYSKGKEEIEKYLKLARENGLESMEGESFKILDRINDFIGQQKKEQSETISTILKSLSLKDKGRIFFYKYVNGINEVKLEDIALDFSHYIELKNIKNIKESDYSHQIEKNYSEIMCNDLEIAKAVVKNILAEEKGSKEVLQKYYFEEIIDQKFKNPYENPSFSIAYLLPSQPKRECVYRIRGIDQFFHPINRIAHLICSGFYKLLGSDGNVRDNKERIPEDYLLEELMKEKKSMLAIGILLLIRVINGTQAKQDKVNVKKVKEDLFRTVINMVKKINKQEVINITEIKKYFKTYDNRRGFKKYIDDLFNFYYDDPLVIMGFERDKEGNYISPFHKIKELKKKKVSDFFMELTDNEILELISKRQQLIK